VTLTIVDGMNVIGSRPHTRWWRDRDQAMRDLVVELESLERTDAILVVFDGYPIAGLAAHRIEVAFAERSGRNAADDRIVELVAAHEAPATILVVTSDAELRGRVTALGAEVRGARSLFSPDR